MRGLIVLLVVFCSLASMGQEPVQFREKTIIFKVKQDYRSYCEDNGLSVPSLSERIEELGIEQLFRKFPQARPLVPSRTTATLNPNMVDISLIYELKYTSNMPLPKAIRYLNDAGVCEYVEGAFIYKPCFVPSDSRINKQWHLDLISAFEAWDIDTGSSDITIAIVDTGVDWDHPDLINSIQYNYSDPIDGLDNDSNSFVDDFRGWNFFDDNNDPDELSWSHGTHVAGLAGATANNNFGVVGTGYACRILPVKSGDRLQITHGYEGVIYSADMGVQVINCSWGSGSISEFGEDAIRYAVFNKNIVVTAGGGNNNNEVPFFPAALPFVISVGATDSLDRKAEFSTFGYQIDLMAPGARTFSTENDTLEYESGTSMAAPIVAGAAALLVNRFPEMSPLQIAEQLKTTTDDIYGIAPNDEFIDKLGSGRLNMRRALDSVISPAVQIEFYEISDNNDETYQVGERLTLGVELVNYLNPTGDITVTLTSLSDNLEVIDSVWQTAALTTNARINNFQDPFSFDIVGFNEYNEQVALRLIITDGNYTQRKFIEFDINQDYVNLNVNNIQTSVSSRGNFGYADDFRLEGLGFVFENEPSFIYDGGLMIGYKSGNRTRVVDRIRNASFIDQDFGVVEVIKESPNSTFDDFEAVGVFNDTPAIDDEIGLEISQRAIASRAFGKEDFVIIEYTITNRSGEDIPDLYVGMCADWDIHNPDRNRGLSQPGRKMGYVHFVDDEELSVGIQLLSEFPFFSYMIDNESISGGGVNLWDEDGFSLEDKFTTLSTNRFEAGTQEVGNDVIQVASAGGISLREDESVTVAFSLMAGRTQEAVIAAADSAFKSYNGYLPGENVYAPFQFVSLNPNPASDHCLVEFDLETSDVIQFLLIDQQGRPVAEVLNKSFFQGRNRQLLNLPSVPSGPYILQVRGSNFERNLLLQIVKSDG